MAEQPKPIDRAEAFLAGKEMLSFEEADALWRRLKKADDLSAARRVLERLRAGKGLNEELPTEPKTLNELCQQEALLTSKDPELPTGMKHDRALEILAGRFDLESSELDGDTETLGIAGGIYKRRFDDLGQLEDLRRAARAYRRGAGEDLGSDAYAHINAAMCEDLLADAGDRQRTRRTRRRRARALRQRIVDELPVQQDNWWNVATRAEAHLGLGNYNEALAAIETEARPDPWELQTTARQLAKLAHIREERPLDHPQIAQFFERLVPGGSLEAVRSVLIGKVGLGLSGGGFRASFFHLGVLAYLAERGVLPHVEVLSCVSGGSVLGACYWLELRRRLVALEPSVNKGIDRVDYVDLVQTLIRHFEGAVAVGLREQLQGSKPVTALRLWLQKGAMDSEAAAEILEEHFFRPLLPGTGPLYMDDLKLQPGDHDKATGGFNPTRHNWLRADKVPALVINATTVNTGHAWQFTPGWMGESPWSAHEVADTVPRLEWQGYDAESGWRMTLARAVAASAGVPGIFAPLRLDDVYEDLVVQLIDGGIYDNQGAAALLAYSCNVVVISDAAGQLQLEDRPQGGLGGLAAYFMRSMDTLMERVRQSTYGDLRARSRTGLLRGLMFLHMKAGLDADPIRPKAAKKTFPMTREAHSPSGVRRDFQQALANLRTDLDAFTETESRCLMACGYQMAKSAIERDLGGVGGLTGEVGEAGPEWPFEEMLREITSEGELTDRQEALLAELEKGRDVVM